MMSQGHSCTIYSIVTKRDASLRIAAVRVFPVIKGPFSLSRRLEAHVIGL